MQIVLKILKALGLTIFALGILGSMATTLNFLFQFTESSWLGIRFLRLYLFLTVIGILIYILIRFRRKPGE